LPVHEGDRREQLGFEMSACGVACHRVLRENYDGRGNKPMMPYRTKTRLRRYKLLLKRAAVLGGILWISFNVLLGGPYIG